LQYNNKTFYLWYYGYINNNEENKNNIILNSINDKKELIFKIIKPEIENYKDELKNNLNEEKNSIKHSRIISFIESKNLIVIHNFFTENYLTFYKIEKSIKLNIRYIGKIIPRKDQNIFSITNNNCCIINNQYLIIGSLRNKNAKYGGFYIIDLDKIIIVYYISNT
jgi:hypothetical protein